MMATLLEMAKNIHPTHTLSEEELASRYIEIHPAIRRDIEFFIQVYPQTSAPLFISGQIGSGKSTLLKSFLFDNPKIHYCDISDVSIANPKDSLEVSLVIVYKIFQVTNSQADLSYIINLINKNRSDDLYDEVGIDDIINTLQGLKNEHTLESNAIIIDGLDRFLELSDYKTLTTVLLKYASIWKVLEQKLIFVTPLLFTQSQESLAEYVKRYQSDELDQTHITIPVPDPNNIILWKNFISVRAQLDELSLSDQQINELVELSGGVLRGTLVVLRHLLNLMYRKGDIVVKDDHIKQLREDVQQSLNNLMRGLSSNDLKILHYISTNMPSRIPYNAFSLFTRDVSLALLTQRERKTLCVLHPLLEITTIEDDIKRKVKEEVDKEKERQRIIDEDEIPW
jgi:hypothetical protein